MAGKDSLYSWTLAGLAALVAVVSARPFAGGWNDGSRLAMVESLVDHRTLAIDQSIFVKVPADPARSPYPADDEILRRGTLDKLYVKGRFYTDKSPVPALLLALIYQMLQGIFGLIAGQSPGLFCYIMTLCSSGVSYMAATVGVYWIARCIGLGLKDSLWLTASFALGTLALVYTRHVNNHIMLLGVTTLLMLELVRLAHGGRTLGRLLTIGSLAGFGYSIDLGIGPPLWACTLIVVAWRTRWCLGLILCVLASAPWLLLHHVVNYAIGGTIGPANAVADYFLWEGSPFSAQNLTGNWQHEDVGHFLLYAASLLFGKHGFLNHDLPLLLLAPALRFLTESRLRNGKLREWPEVLFVLVFCGGTWLVYALTSRNHAGACCSIRWFVPWLGPLYLLLAILLRERPSYRRDVLLLCGWGTLFTLVAWWFGPWMRHLVPAYWLMGGAALIHWIYQRRRSRREVTARSEDPPMPLAA